MKVVPNFIVAGELAKWAGLDPNRVSRVRFDVGGPESQIGDIATVEFTVVADDALIQTIKRFEVGESDR